MIERGLPEDQPERASVGTRDIQILFPVSVFGFRLNPSSEVTGLGSLRKVAIC